MNIQRFTLPAAFREPAFDSQMHSTMVRGTLGDDVTTAGNGSGFDRIGQMWQPPWFGGMAGSQGGFFSQLFSMISQLLTLLRGGQGMHPGSATPFSSAQGSSTGDPHLDFSGKTASGGNTRSHFDSMRSHSDLLDSDSFAGGYRISTVTTDPTAQGITWNRKATVSTNFGSTQISLDAKGRAEIIQHGRARSLQNGQSIDLGNGETVVRNADGSLLISDKNALGGSIATTLRQDGNGVDVSFDAANVDLSGDLVTNSI